MGNKLPTSAIPRPEFVHRAASNFFELKAKDLNGSPFNFQSLRSRKAILLNNVSLDSEPRFPDFQQMSQLQKELGDKGLQILVFPYGGDSISAEDVKKEIAQKYQTTMQVFQRIKREKVAQHPVYKFLASNAPQGVEGVFSDGLKILVNKNGKIVKTMGQGTPSQKVKEAILEELGK